MMQPSVTIKSETIEDAIQQALSILDASIDEVDISVLSSPTKSIFGNQKALAEVKITKLAPKDELTIESFVDQFETHVEEENTVCGIWIIDEKVHVSSTKNRYPILEVGQGVEVWINGVQVTQRQVIASDDQMRLKTTDELVPATFSIELEPQNMTAYLDVKQGKRVKRRVKDVPMSDSVVVEAEEEVLPMFDLKMEEVMEKVKIMNMVGVDYAAIASAVNSLEGGRVAIAKGTPPVKGRDGYLEILYDNDVFQSVRDQRARVDFREKNAILTVEEGDVLAQIIPATNGKPGKDVFGNVILPPVVQEVDLRLTNHVAQKEARIIAVTSGRPLIETRGRLVKVDIVKELIHHGDVTIESGNIRFQGDVVIKGDIDDSMVVEAAGRITIDGNCTKAEITSAQSVLVRKNVFSTSINVGKANIIINELVLMLRGIVPQFEQMRTAIRQIMEVNNQTKEELQVHQLHHLIRLLMEKKFPLLKEKVHMLIQKVRENHAVLDREWTDMADKLNQHILVLSTQTNTNDYSPLVDEVRELYEMYCIPPEPKSNLSLSYAINSHLYCSGNIFVTDQGAYHCNIQAGNAVRIANVCRGGMIVAGKNATFDELGSEIGVKTIVQVPHDGLIQINHVYQGTEIHIGNRRHTFAVEEYHVKAHIGADGMIALR
ncbi:flagellar assembly protein A [Paenisporosarcina cavernae]|uniref:DUF342 domain-containing protein n=1 Tax=Paenisporosarcina cavernae TaxID=2320858 RepID=A0A385YTK4_9BACL|nr:flagellar assembly protein A [Paenisporosarcina cavernae]AYC28902.1 DUF342 domain-containing protein [Paenisporosarcina cavernae]